MLQAVTDDDTAASDESRPRDAMTTPNFPKSQPSGVQSPRLIMPRSSRADRFFHWLFLMLSFAVLAISATLRVRNGQQIEVPIVNAALPGLCVYKTWFGVDCPGCGLTRCFVSLAHGRVLDAWHFNPAGILVFCLMIGQLPYRAIQLYRIRRGLVEHDLSRIGLWCLGVLTIVLLAQWALRTGLRI